MARLFVTYPATEGARFDRDYYVGTHLPLAEAQWGPFGLISAQAFFPARSRAGEIAVAVLTFADEASIDSALASSATAAVLADLPNFTTITPELSKGVAP